VTPNALKFVMMIVMDTRCGSVTQRKFQLNYGLVKQYVNYSYKHTITC